MKVFSRTIHQDTYDDLPYPIFAGCHIGGLFESFTCYQLDQKLIEISYKKGGPLKSVTPLHALDWGHLCACQRSD